VAKVEPVAWKLKAIGEGDSGSPANGDLAGTAVGFEHPVGGTPRQAPVRPNATNAFLVVMNRPHAVGESLGARLQINSGKAQEDLAQRRRDAKYGTPQFNPPLPLRLGGFARDILLTLVIHPTRDWLGERMICISVFCVIRGPHFRM